MTTARLRIDHAGPHVSFQDGGRPGNLRFGIPRSGPMDQLALAAANLALGVDPLSTTIEVSRADLVLTCIDGAVSVAVAGGDFTGSWHVRTLYSGDQLVVRAERWGSWAYVAVLGDIAATTWLGHTATHSMSGFGGGALSTGQEINIENASADASLDGELEVPPLARPSGVVRVVMGPQLQHFKPDAVEQFIAGPYALTEAFDRMGVRLDGPTLALREALSIPSEPIVRGSVQVGGDGVPTVLLADHQTTGGYPKIATIISCDLDRFSQLRPGESVTFEPVSPEDAIAATRSHAGEVEQYLNELARPGRTLAQRLMSENLIGVHREID